MTPAGDTLNNLGSDIGIFVTNLDIRGFITRFPCLPDVLPEHNRSNEDLRIPPRIPLIVK
jgi:hypothetical protein